MPFADNPHGQFSPGARVWEDTNKVVKPTPPTLTDDQLYDLNQVAVTNGHVAGLANPANPANPNSPFYPQFIASTANPKHPNHSTFLAARPTKKDK